MRRLVALLALIGAGRAAAQERVVIEDRGPGASGRVLESILARPHRVVPPDTGWFRLRRGEQGATSLVILGRTAAIEGPVNGDVIVVGGDLFVRPGGRIEGRAVAIGGGVYPSTLSVVTGGTQSFRDNTFAIAQDGDAFRLSYESLAEYAPPPLLLPGIYGFRMPLYDRVNGASIVFGPAFSLLGGRAEANALVTYRSDLGKIDPSLNASAQLTRRVRAEGYVGRGTFTNDAWIWSDFVNSFYVLLSGDDTRNYYRADRAVATVHRVWEWTHLQLEPYVGALVEDGWSVGPAQGEHRGPWSLLERDDTLGMQRPNPAIDEGTVASALAGVRLQYETEDFRVRARSRAEIGASTPTDQGFTQVTTDLDARFPTFGEQEYAADVHWVTTANGPPRQRFAYLGGAGTLPFHAMLEQGGDELLLVDQRYSIPLPRVRLGLLGEPTLIFRHRLASAGIDRLPDFEQVLGAGVLLTILRIEVQVDPARGEARITSGFSFSR